MKSGTIVTALGSIIVASISTKQTFRPGQRSRANAVGDHARDEQLADQVDRDQQGAVAHPTHRPAYEIASVKLTQRSSPGRICGGSADRLGAVLEARS